ncbi:RNA-binding cell elongation regulator Jag/EloR [Blautia coccoides]|uniref:RNA-binding cell elongation regulator Jag/EloR n=1 Tax=Blautia producta TaxID=33035 RepID=UPI0028A32B1E|nr:RNA-binding cell elongation regulator Jag/EloR [Blautia coccoides]MDT4374824.1 RNA-binding cell elongation regulator Jag/EloR [Blautia coccoides]
MEFKEFSAKTVDEAITKACLDFETSSENLEIQVLFEGSSGFLGFGAKPARVNVRRKEVSLPEEPVIKEAVPVKEERKEEAKEERKETKREFKSEPKKEPKREPKKEVRRTEAPKEEVKPQHEERKVVERTEEEITAVKADAEKFLNGVFKAMELEVEIKMEYKSAEGNLEIEFLGEDMGILIGKRGQTLDSLQYLTSLVVNKGRQGYIRVKLDTEGYRNRRKETLENLAKSIAYKVRKTRKPVSLEPMNPYERRIIHSALQGNRYVETYSEGNEPYRHVVVKLKK